MSANHPTPHERTFASLTACDSALTIGTNSQGILVGIKRGGKTVQATTVAFTDAPDGAIAFLQSAVPTGQQIPAEFARAMEALGEYKQRIQTEAEEAADRDALQAEAVALYRAYYRALYEQETGLEWADLDHDARVLATALATTARELHPESTR